MEIRKHIVCFCLFFITFSLRAQVVVELALDTTSMRIGEQAALRISVKSPKGAVVQFPNYALGSEIIAGVEVVKVGKVDTLTTSHEQEQWWRKEYLLTSFDTATYEIHSCSVFVNNNYYLPKNKVTLTVGDSIYKEKLLIEEVGLRLPKETDAAWQSWGVFLLLLLSFFGIGTIGVASYLKKLSRAKIKQVKLQEEPPHLLALQELDLIKEKYPLLENDLVQKACFDELVSLLRCYIQKRYHLSTKEKTSAEIIAFLQPLSKTPEIERLKKVTEVAELVRFSKQKVSDNLVRECLEEVEAYLHTTKEEAAVKEKEVVVKVSPNRQKVILWRRVYWLMVSLFLIFFLWFVIGLLYVFF